MEQKQTNIGEDGKKLAVLSEETFWIAANAACQFQMYEKFSFYVSLNVSRREQITKQAALEVKKFPSLISSKCMKSFSFYVSLNVFLHEQITKQAALEVKKFPPKRTAILRLS